MFSSKIDLLTPFLILNKIYCSHVWARNIFYCYKRIEIEMEFIIIIIILLSTKVMSQYMTAVW